MEMNPASSPEFDSWLRQPGASFMELACSPHVCVAFLQIIRSQAVGLIGDWNDFILGAGTLQQSGKLFRYSVKYGAGEHAE